MTFILVLLLAMLAGAILGVNIGWYLSYIDKKLKILIDREPEEKSGVANVVSPDKIDYAASAIVNPKSPAEIEAQDRLEVERKIKEAQNRG